MLKLPEDISHFLYQSSDEGGTAIDDDEELLQLNVDREPDNEGNLSQI